MLDHQHIETSLHCCLHWFILATSYIYLLRLPRMHSGINVDILHFYNIRFQQYGRACGCYLININQTPNSVVDCMNCASHLYSGTYYQVYNIHCICNIHCMYNIHCIYDIHRRNTNVCISLNTPCLVQLELCFSFPYRGHSSSHRTSQFQ